MSAAALPLTGLSATGTNIFLGPFSAGALPADPTITTSGTGQTYNGPVILDENTTFTDTGTGAIHFLSSVDNSAFTGSNTLTVTTKGPVTFDQAVGSNTPIASLSVTGATIAFNGSVTVNNTIGAITTAAGGGLNGDITLGNGVTLTAFGSAGTGTGSTIVIEAGSDHLAGDTTGGDFVNNGGANALVTPNGDWVVYTGDTVGSGTVDGALTYTRYYDYDTGFTPSPAGNYMVFRGGALTLTPNAATATFNGVALDNAAYSDNLANYSTLPPTNGVNSSAPSGTTTLSGSMAFNGSPTTVVRNAGTYTLGQGSLTLNTPDHLGLSFSNSGGNAYVINPLEVVVSGSRAFDGTTNAPAAILSITNNLDGANVSLTGSGNLAGSGVGSEALFGAGSLALGGSAAGNYTLAGIGESGSFVNIGSATLTYVATPVTVFQGSSIPMLTGTVTGFVGGDTLATATTGTLTWGTNATSSNIPGHFAIDGSGLTATGGSFTFSGGTSTFIPNYIFTQSSGNATALTIETISGSLINQTSQPPQSELVSGVQLFVPFLERPILSSDNSTPPDPTLIYSRPG